MAKLTNKRLAKIHEASFLLSLKDINKGDFWEITEIILQPGISSVTCKPDFIVLQVIERSGNIYLHCLKNINDPSSDMERHFVTYKTGDILTYPLNSLKFIGSVIGIDSKSYHVFELIDK